MGVVLAEIVAVVGGNEPQAEILFQLEQTRVNAVLHLKALILNFEKEILFAEDVGEGSGGRPGCVVVVLHQALGNFALQASGEPDPAARKYSARNFLADTRLVVEAVQRGLRGDFD